MDGLLATLVFKEFPHFRVLILRNENVGGVGSRVHDSLGTAPLLIHCLLLLWGQFDRHGQDSNRAAGTSQRLS